MMCLVSMHIISSGTSDGREEQMSVESEDLLLLPGSRRSYDRSTPMRN